MCCCCCCGPAFRALLRRNFIYRKRRWGSSIFDFGLPVVFIVFLVLIKIGLEGTDDFSPENVAATFPTDNDVIKTFSFRDYVTALQAKKVCLKRGAEFQISGITAMPERGSSLNGWPVPFVKCDRRKCTEDGQDATLFCEFPILAVAPTNSADGTADRSRVASFVKYVNENYLDSASLPFEYDFIQSFSSSEAINDYVTSEHYGKIEENLVKPKIGVAVVLGGSGKTYDYTLRVNSTNFNIPENQARPVSLTTPPTSRLYKTFANEDTACEMQGGSPDLGRKQTSCTAQYMYNGALPIQRLVGDWILDNAGSTAKVAENGVSFVPFPTREYTKNGFYKNIAPFAPLFAVLGFLYPVSSMIRSVVMEKELRQKELMKMMSVAESTIEWSWYTSYFAFYFFSAVCATAATKGLYSNSGFVLLLIFWLLAYIAIIVYCMVISAIFSKATRATLVGVLIFFVGYFLSLIVNYEDGSPGAIAGISIVHPVPCFAYGMQVIGALEDSGAGLTRDTFNSSDLPSEFTFRSALRGLLSYIIIWCLIGMYLNRVIKGDYGQALPWYYPFTKTYWCPSKIVSDVAEDLSQSEIESPYIEPVSDALREQESEGRTVQICGLTKHYGDKIAVDGLNLTMYSGQVTALLGHNGAGKTTTINMLTGMVEPTSGYAKVAGKDIRTQLTQIRQGVGICLQHDCLFPLLTVKEHLEFFAGVKGMYDKTSEEEVKQSVETAMKDVALYEKRNTQSKALSGGMKRKLSVAIAFTGDSKVVFLDEPTSGMDPFSRRYTWNVIRQYRQDRCIVLTTHFMDEADLLGDRVAIMGEGNLRCVGSSLFLKKAYGVGYQLTIAKKVSGQDTPTEYGTNNVEPEIDEKLKNIVMSNVADAKLLSNVGTEISFQLPIGASENFTGMFGELDGLVEEGKIATYGVSITTLDEVFLMVARGDEGKSGLDEFKMNVMKSSVGLQGADSAVPLPNTEVKDPELASNKSYRSQTDLEKNRVFSRHVRALFAKRAMNFKRDKKAWCCSAIFPSVCVLIGLLLVTLVAPSRNLESLTLSLEDNNPDLDPKDANINERPNPIPFNKAGNPYTCQPGRCLYEPSTVSIEETGEAYSFCGKSSHLNGSFSCNIAKSDDYIETITQYGAFPISSVVKDTNQSSHTLADNSQNLKPSQYGAIYFTHDENSTIVDLNNTDYDEAAISRCLISGNTYINGSQCQRFGGIGYIISYNFTSLHSSVLYQAVADESIVKETLGDSEFSINPTIHPLPITSVEEKFSQAEDSFNVWFLIILSFPFISGTFGTFIVAERESKAKHLQTVAGVKPTAYWFSSFLWDVMNYQLPLWIVIILMFITGIDTFTSSDRGILGGVITTLFLYGPASAGFTYIASFLFESPSKCNLVLIVFNFLIGLAGPMAVFILRLIDASQREDCVGFGNECTLGTLTTIATLIEWVLRFFPAFNLGKALFFTINIQSFVFIEKDQDLTVWSTSILLIEVIFLAFQSVLYLAIAVYIDILSTNPNAVLKWKTFVRFITCKCLCFWKKSASDDNIVSHSTKPVDEDVIAEANRVESGEAEEESIVIRQLKKVYDNGKIAVDEMSLGIPPGQCFGLLGINGAGKTTTMGMLTAEFPPTSGDAFLSGFSVTNEPEQTRQRIGYVPQFDAHFTNMTGREHVELYAAIKGVPKDVVKEATIMKLSEVGLNEYDSDRISAGYSGGMKRKLSVAMATIGQPRIVFLDEPSTGMDPVARRDLWQVILNMVDGNGSAEEKTSVILTTHSMEECEAICSRIGIMAAGNLRCLGSAQHLKSRYGKGFQVEMKIKGVETGDDDYQAVESTLANSIGVSSSTRDSAVDEFNVTDVESGNGDNAEVTFLSLDQARSMAQSLTGDDSISSKITPNDATGYVIYKNATSEVGVPLEELAAFCVEELRIKAVLDLINNEYSGSILRERQDNKVRLEIPSEGVKISSIFATIEENKSSLKLLDYGVSQTSLEQVFNMHAAEAEKWKLEAVDG